MFRDRFELSKKNNWVDEHGNVYLIFTTKDLCELLNCGTQKATKIKKELESFNLLEQERMGLNKPNKIYILEPKKPSEGMEDKEFRKSKFQSSENQNSGILKIKKQEFRKSKSNDTELNNTEFIKTENNDTHDMNDTYNNPIKNNHSNHTNHQQTEFNNDALKFQVLEELPQQLQDYLSKFEIREIRIIKSVLLKGKKSFNNAHDTYYRLEDVEFEIVSVLKRFKAMLLQKNETVESMQGYLMQSIKAEFEEIHALYMRRQNMKQHNIFNQ